MLKKLIKTTVLLLGGMMCAYANGFLITCPLNLNTDDHLYRDFVQNCGARVEDIEPNQFQITFASLHNLEAADAAHMRNIVTDWVAHYRGQFGEIKLDLSDVRYDAGKIYLTTSFLENGLYHLRDSLQQAIHGAKFPSGKTYDLDANSRNFHLFSMVVGDTNGLKAKRIQRATETLRDRVSQAKLVYPEAYTQVLIEEPVLMMN